MSETKLKIPISCEIPKQEVELASPELSDKEFVEQIEKRVLDTINRFKLFNKEDKVLVAVSGGKDSTMLAYILKKYDYKIEGVTVNAHIGCYTEENLKNLRQVCKQYDIPLHEISFRKEFGGSLVYIRDTINSKGQNLKSCSVCGVFRRWLINKRAQEVNPKCIAFGHNMDDESQAFFMNIIKNNLAISARMGPTTGQSKNKKLIPRVKPLYFVSELEVVRYVKALNFPVYVGKCPCSIGGQRNYIKDMFNNLEKKYPHLKSTLINYFLDHKKLLKEQFQSEAMGVCQSCQEPASKNLCRTCQLLEHYNS